MSRTRKSRDRFELLDPDGGLFVEHVDGEFQVFTWGPLPTLAKPPQIEALAKWMREKEAGR